MIKKIKIIVIFLILLNIKNFLLAENNFFDQGKIKFNEKKYDESKFLFQRSIVFNPKDTDSYLYTCTQRYACMCKYSNTYTHIHTLARTYTYVHT